MNIVIHEDMPRYDAGAKIVLTVPVAILVFAVVQVYLTDGLEAALFMAIPIAMVCLIFSLVMPRRYQVLDDRIKVVLGSGLSLSCRFSNIKEIAQRRGIRLSVNFVTAFSSKRVVYIIRSRWMPLAITPTDPQAFLGAAGRAMASWKRIAGVEG